MKQRNRYIERLRGLSSLRRARRVGYEVVISKMVISSDFIEALPNPSKFFDDQARASADRFVRKWGVPYRIEADNKMIGESALGNYQVFAHYSNPDQLIVISRYRIYPLE